jgi:hypothetical protein
MLFKKEHQEMILNGTKTATRRVWKKPMVKVGGVYKAKLQMLSKDYFAKIKVTRLYKQGLYFITEEDARKEGYHNIEEFSKIWIKINGEWNPNLIVYAIEFEVVNDGNT